MSKWPVVAMTIYSQPPASRKSQFRASRAPQLASARSAERRSEHRGAPAVPTRQSELMRCLAGLQCGLLPCITAVTGAQWRRRSVRQEHCKRSSACGAAPQTKPSQPTGGVCQRHVCLHCVDDWVGVTRRQTYPRTRRNELSPATPAPTSVGQALDAEVFHPIPHILTTPALYPY